MINPELTETKENLGLVTPKHFGNAVLDELTNRGKRYTNLSYAEHQELKVAKTIEDLELFFSKNMPGIDSSSQNISQIVSSMEMFWAARSTSEIKSAIWQGLFSSEIGIVCLVLASPILLIRHCYRRLRGNTTRR
jgi:hypothetical protein